MIHAKELRIGNKFRGIAGIQTVLSIEDNTNRNTLQYQDESHKLMYSHLILCLENRNQYKPCEVEGIELTPEWFERQPTFAKISTGARGFPTGYEVVTRASAGRSLVFSYDKVLKAYYVFIGDGFEYKKYQMIDATLRYAHQVQNLYFAICHNELEIIL